MSGKSYNSHPKLNLWCARTALTLARDKDVRVGRSRKDEKC